MRGESCDPKYNIYIAFLIAFLILMSIRFLWTYIALFNSKTKNETRSTILGGNMRTRLALSALIVAILGASSATEQAGDECYGEQTGGIVLIALSTSADGIHGRYHRWQQARPVISVGDDSSE